MAAKKTEDLRQNLHVSYFSMVILLGMGIDILEWIYRKCGYIDSWDTICEYHIQRASHAKHRVVHLCLIERNNTDTFSAVSHLCSAFEHYWHFSSSDLIRRAFFLCMLIYVLTDWRFLQRNLWKVSLFAQKEHFGLVLILYCGLIVVISPIRQTLYL